MKNVLFVIGVDGSGKWFWKIVDQRTEKWKVLKWGTVRDGNLEVCYRALKKAGLEMAFEGLPE